MVPVGMCALPQGPTTALYIVATGAMAHVCRVWTACRTFAVLSVLSPHHDMCGPFRTFDLIEFRSRHRPTAGVVRIYEERPHHSLYIPLTLALQCSSCSRRGRRERCHLRPLCTRTYILQFSGRSSMESNAQARSCLLRGLLAALDVPLTPSRAAAAAQTIVAGGLLGPVPDGGGVAWAVVVGLQGQLMDALVSTLSKGEVGAGPWELRDHVGLCATGVSSRGECCCPAWTHGPWPRVGKSRTHVVVAFHIQESFVHPISSTS